MRVTLGHLLMPIAPLAAGALLIYLGLAQGWGVVWAAGGATFIVISLSAWTLTAAWMAQGPAGAILRSPVVSIGILVLVVGSICATLVLAVVQNNP